MLRLTPLLFLLGGCPGGGETETEPDTDDRPCDQVDDDSDGVNACDDCDDDDASVYPGAVEACDGVDTDCDGTPHPSETLVDGVPACAACDDAGYWMLTRDVTSAVTLEDVLEDPMSGLRCNYSESGAYMFVRLDNHAGQVECVYTGRTTPVAGERPDPNTDMNVEHTWPQSEGADALPMKCDLHHLYPADVDANSTRANHPFGEVARNVDWSVGGSSLGDDANGNTVFEPRDVHKGNVARSMLYMSFQYDWPLSASQVALFKAWHELDPPDEDEIERTVGIAEYQNHENPFVVCPDLVEVAF